MPSLEAQGIFNQFRNELGGFTSAIELSESEIELIEHPEQLPEILEQAAELAQYAGRVLLIPKCDVEIPEKYWLGYSVDSGYGSTPLKPDWFGSRPIHLLGGSPKKQALLYPQMNVVSLDANYAQNLATNYCKAVWSDGEKNIEQREQDCYEALALSLSKQFEFWRNGSFPTPETKPANKETDKWYTPPNIENLVTQVLGAIDLDPCADDGKHIAAAHHYTAADDGLSQEWHGRVFMNPPYSCPGKWIAKLQAEVEAGRVTEAIALVPAATDTNWLSPLLASQPVCFWKGRIKFLDTSYQPKQSARQSHCLIYWGENWQRFKEVFDTFGVVKMPEGKWNPAHFGDVPYKSDGDQLSIFYEDTHEPPEPDDYPTIPDYEQAWAEWEKEAIRSEELMPNAQCPMPNDSQLKDKTMTFQFSGTQAIASQIAQLQEQLNLLTASLKPYQECEQKAEDLRREVAQYSLEMINKAIPQDDIFDWAKSLYSAASGLNFVDTTAFSNQNDLAAIAAQNEAIANLRAELAGAIKRQEQAQEDLKKFSITSIEVATKLKFCEQERDQLKLELENLSAQTDTATVALQKENLSLITKIQKLENFKKQTIDQTISEQIIDILKDQNELSGNQIIESLGMDDEAGRGVYTALNRLLAKNTISAIQDPLDKRRNLYRLYSANNTQHDTQYLANNTQHNTLKATPALNVASFTLGSRVAVIDVGEKDNLEYLIGNKGTVVGVSVNGDSVAVLFEKRLEFDEHEVVLSSRYLNLVEKAHPDIHSQFKGQEFTASIKTKSGMNNLTWQNISDVCQSNPVILREICHAASTKLQKDFTDIDNLAKLMSEYIVETDNITDFNWLDKTFIAKVEVLVETKKSLPYHKGDRVQNLETGAIYEVRSFDGEWLSVVANSKITSLHKSEVELIHLKVAA